MRFNPRAPATKRMVTTHIAPRLVLLVTLITIVAGGRCKIPVPFNSELVGRRFSASDGCCRPSGIIEVRINAQSILFRPLFITRFNLPICFERYVFHFRSDREHPFVVYFPRLRVSPMLDRESELPKFCNRRQLELKEKYFPVGETRKRFKESVRAIIKGVSEIRDFGCTQDDQGVCLTPVRGRALTNVDVDGIVTYLLGVAYQYNFCAETGMDEHP